MGKDDAPRRKPKFRAADAVGGTLIALGTLSPIIVRSGSSYSAAEAIVADVRSKNAGNALTDALYNGSQDIGKKVAIGVAVGGVGYAIVKVNRWARKRGVFRGVPFLG
jgi:hypothetical protein